LQSPELALCGMACLWREDDLGMCPFPRDLDAVRERRGGCHCPAAAAVRRDVLVLEHREIILAADVRPVERVWQVRDPSDLVWAWCADPLSFRK